MVNNPLPSFVQQVLTSLQMDNPIFLGKGGEGHVFAYKDDCVIKIYGNTSQEYLEGLVRLQKYLLDARLPFATPAIQEIGHIEETYYTIEKRLSGILMEQKFLHVSSKEKYVMLESYYKALNDFHKMKLPDLPYGNLLNTAMALTDETWPGFLLKILEQRIPIAEKRLRKDVKDLDKKVQQFKEIIQKELVIDKDKKCFVHGDYYVNQVLVDEKNHISAVLDMGIHSVVGDFRQDLASICFFEDRNYAPEHIQFLTNLAVKDYGENILRYNDIYKIYYSFYFSDIYNHNPQTYYTFVNYLNDEQLWKRLS